MQSQATIDTPRVERFKLDAEPLAKLLFERTGDAFGFDQHHERGFAHAVRERFDDACDAGAILCPANIRVGLHALSPIALMVVVREREMPDTVKWPLRQLATVAFDVDEVGGYGDDSFAECCATIRELLRRADALLPALAMLGAAGV
jgi:hypothetical protein